jgi:hypothetical protein
MSQIITDQEWTLLVNMTDDTLVHMAADLQLSVPPRIDRRTLCDACVRAIVVRAQREGLPFSKYDQDDLESLSQDERVVLCRLLSIQPTGSIPDILKAGTKTYRFYLKNRPDSPTAMMIPSLLPAIARHAKEIQTQGNAV